MLWSEFTSLVKLGLAYDQYREKYGDFIDQQIRYAALDLQADIEELRKEHTTRFDSRHITVKGAAGLIDVPEGMQVDHVHLKPKRAFASSDADTDTKIVLPFPESVTGGAVALTLKLWVRGELQPDAMVVEGAGSSSLNGVYLRNGDANGKPRYTPSDPLLSNVIFWSVANEWFVGAVTDSYTSTEDVATPDLVATWNVGSSVTAPAPTVRRATWADIDAAGIDRATVPTLPLNALVSTDAGDDASVAMKGDGSWEYHEVTLNVADPDAATEIYLGFDGTDYATCDWSEIAIESGAFYDQTFFGETETERLYATKKLERYPWDRRNELITGDTTGIAPGWYAHDRHSLWAYKIDEATLAEGATLTLEMTGRKLSFEDSDETPFDERCTEVASLRVRYKLLKHIDKLNEGWKVQADYQAEKAALIADYNAR